jgi:hypothetical protein
VFAACCASRAQIIPHFGRGSWYTWRIKHQT